MQSAYFLFLIFCHLENVLNQFSVMFNHAYINHHILRNEYAFFSASLSDHNNGVILSDTTNYCFSYKCKPPEVNLGFALSR